MTKYRETSIPTILNVIAIFLFFGGFIAGIAFGKETVYDASLYSSYTRKEFSFANALIYWSTSFISGMLLMAVSEIIRQLQDIAGRVSELNAALGKTLAGKETEKISVADLPEL